MKSFKFLFALVCLLGITGVTYAQKATITGTVIDSDSDEPIPFMNVYVKDNVGIGTTTDFEGNYTLKVEAGTYTLVFSSIEFGSKEETVTVAAGENKTLNKEIGKEDVQIETIIVKTDKYEKPIEDVTSSMEIIKPNIIENKGSTEVTSALEQAPGLTIVDSEPQLRGGSGYSFGAGSRVMILVDDLPLLSGDAGRPSWGFVPIENIEQIEVIKGASSVLYGSAALNGVINIRTAYPKSEPQTKVILNTGVYDAPRDKNAKWWEENPPFYTGINFFHSRRTSKYFSFVVGGNAYIEKGYIGPMPNSDAERIQELGNDLENGDISQEAYADSVDKYDDLAANNLEKGEFENRLRLNFNTKVKSKKFKGLSYGLNGNFMYSRSGGNLIWLNEQFGKYRANGGALTTTKQTIFNIDPYVEYYDQKGNKYSINTRVFHTNNDNDNNQANKNTVFYGEFRYFKRFKNIPDFNISAGVMGNHVIGTSELFAGGSGESVANRSATNLAVYAQLEKKLFGRWNIVGGARWEYFSIEGERNQKPVFRLGTTFRIAEATFLRASFGQGFRFPTISERYIETTVGGLPIFPNPDLEPEESWSTELGLKQGVKFGKFLGYIDFAGFYQNYSNYVEFIAGQWRSFADYPETFGIGFRSVNTGGARVFGAEVSLIGQGNFTDNFGVNTLVGYTFSRPQSTTPERVFGESAGGGQEFNYENTSTDTENNILKYRYEHLVKADLEFNIYKLSAGVSFRYYSFMQNVDNIFYSGAAGAILPGTPGSEGVAGIKTYREENEEPEYVFDFRVSYQIADHSKVAFIINNALNREYSLRPLAINAPRTFAIQYTITL